MDKRDLIIKAMQDLIVEQKGASCSVSDIARKAGIGKGSIYYYFKSKEEIFDAVVESTYSRMIEQSKAVVDKSGLDAAQKIGLFLKSYRSSGVAPALDEYLHNPQNAAIHQKSLAKILTTLSPVIAGLLRQGVQEKLFVCAAPEQTAQIMLSVICFLFDPGIFPWQERELVEKMKALADFMEKGLQAPKGTFGFLYA